MTPPAAPTLHPKRCETCDHLKKDCPYFESGYEPLEELTAPTEFLRGCYFVLRDRCPAHSGAPDADARQRIEDVVKELERIKTAINNIDNVPADCKLISDRDYHPSCDSKKCADCMVDNLIALLKDGVGRK